MTSPFPLSPSSDGGLAQEMANTRLSKDVLNQESRRGPPPRYSDINHSGPLNKIVSVRLPNKDPSTLWDVSIDQGRISAIDSHNTVTEDNQPSPGVLHGASRLLAPSLCHAHIHLDKCFLLQDPKFSDLQIESGDFQEAMNLTGQAKARFEEEDLLRRGRQLIEESIHYGVTCMRAFVEIDDTVQFKCLDAGLQLKEEFKERCDVQICAFAQLPLFSGNDGGQETRRLMKAAAARSAVDVLGSTPYVEQDETKSKMNVKWIARLAISHGKHLDLHLDYFLEESKQPLIFSALNIIKERNWSINQGKTIVFGHCTRLIRFGKEEWHQLKQEIHDLPISFIGLPTSDLFMMRAQENLRGTLPILRLIKEFGFDAAIAVNNIGNAFTPQGNCDPLSIASLGVGLYQAGTKKDSQILYETVSSRAKKSIGFKSTSMDLEVGEPADLVLFDSPEAGWRCRKSVTEVIYDPTLCRRQTIRAGKVTAF